ncbi:hypothetical protein KIPB_005202 [Kipferlia bialata]|uniref:SET domain-containing protein n=1 Tax=Kipferlia bialata TaxID=797122 RepID=A0A9K3GIR5_9EUKA|nr:hypothetical protein KIPB_005202 [Kipferlia bialata]|eukprot:g5202.t1
MHPIVCKSLDVVGMIQLPAEVLDLKAKGDSLYKAGQYLQAVVTYSDALRVCPGAAPVLINRAICHFHLGSYGEVVADTTEILGTDANHVKAHFWRAQALYLLGDHVTSRTDFDRAETLKTGTGAKLSKAITKCAKRQEQQAKATIAPLLSSSDAYCKTLSDEVLRATLPICNLSLPHPQPVVAAMDGYKGRSLLATTPCKAGEVVCDLPAILLLRGEQYRNSPHCNHCLRKVSLSRCPRCNLGYCASCSNKPLHKAECRLLEGVKLRKTSATMRAAIRLMALERMSPKDLSASEAGVLQAALPLCKYREEGGVPHALGEPVSGLVTDLANSLQGAVPCLSHREAGRYAHTALLSHYELQDRFIGDLVGLCPFVCLANHHCRPTAEPAIEREEGGGLRLQLKCLRDISAGDHVSLAYANFMPSPNRRERMRRDWGFECDCWACEAFDEFTQAACGVCASAIPRISHEARMEALMQPCAVCTGCHGPVAPVSGLSDAVWVCLDCGEQRPTPPESVSHPRVGGLNALFVTNTHGIDHLDQDSTLSNEWMHPLCFPYILVQREDPHKLASLTDPQLSHLSHWWGESAYLAFLRQRMDVTK